jgi:hypothetical protein
MSSIGGTKPPPPPARVSQQLPVVPPGASPPAPQMARREDSGGLAWDDDELETQIYDNPEDDPRNQKPASGQRSSKPLPLQAPLTPHPSQPLAAAPTGELPERTATLPGGSAVPSLASAASVSSGPDLSSLVSSTAKGWEGGPGSGPSPAATMNGIGLNGAPPKKLATGSNQTVAPEPPHASAMEAPAFNFDSGPRIETGPRDLFDPMASFGQGITKRSSGKKGVLLIAIGGAVAAAIAVVIVIAMSAGKTADKKASTTPPVDDKQPTAAPIVGDQNTGFDLYVSPTGVTQWKLDGETRTDRLPSRIRGITPGPHSVTIEAPAGFMSETQTVNVEMGKAGRVDIPLQPIQGITGVFESTPPGANVSLIIDGKREVLGPAPVKSPLDPRKTYQVLFEKQGYVSVNRPISFTGALEEKTVVNLEKAGSVASGTPPEVKQPEVKQPEVKQPEVKQPKEPKIAVKQPEVKQPEVKQPEVKEPKIDDSKVGTVDPPKEPKAPKAGGQGTLTLGSKPPCEIYVDGTATGLHTPQKDMKLPAGKHRITLINNEFGIKESFAVDVKADEPTKMIKDYSDRLPK